MPYTAPDIINVSAGSTSNNLSNITFSNSNGVSFGLNGSTITASHNGLTSQSNQAVSAANGSSTFQTLSFANSNGVSFSTGTQGLFASHNGLTSQLNQAFSADASSSFQTLVFQDSNGVSFSNNAGSLRVTHGLQFTSNTSNITANALNTSASRVINIVAATNNTGGGTASLSSNVSFSNANGATFYTSAGGAIALSYTVPAGGGGVAISGGANSQSTGTVNFANSNGITFGLSNNGTMTASHNGITTARASNDGVGLNTAQTNVTWTVNSNGISLNAGAYLTTQSNQAFSAQGGSSSFQTLVFTNSNGLSFTNTNGSIAGSYTVPTVTQYFSNTGTTFNGVNVSGSMTLNTNGLQLSLSAPTPGGGGAINVTAGTTSGNLQTIQFDNANGVSFGLDGSTITASVNAGGGGLTLSYFNPQDAYLQVGHQQGQATLHIQPMQAPNVTYDRIMIPYLFTGASNSTASITLSNWVGIFTRNDSTLSLLTSFSSSTAFTHSGTASSSVYNGIRLFSISNAGELLTEGQYWVGHISRTTSGGANATFSHMAASQQNSNFSGLFGVGTNATYQYTRGLGHYSASTTAMPNSIAFSQINGTASAVLRQPLFYFVSGTV